MHSPDGGGHWSGGAHLQATLDAGCRSGRGGGPAAAAGSAARCQGGSTGDSGGCGGRSVFIPINSLKSQCSQIAYSA